MKKLLAILPLALCLSGCALFQQPTATTPGGALAALVTPASLASDVTTGITVGSSAFLARNPSYSAEVLAVANALTTLASGNLTSFSSADLGSILAKTSISSSTQAEISSLTIAALGIYETQIGKNFPTLKTQYALFVQAVANGLLQSLGKPALPLPGLTAYTNNPPNTGTGKES